MKDFALCMKSDYDWEHWKKHMRRCEDGTSGLKEKTDTKGKEALKAFKKKADAKAKEMGLPVRRRIILFPYCLSSIADVCTLYS